MNCFGSGSRFVDFLFWYDEDDVFLYAEASVRKERKSAIATVSGSLPSSLLSDTDDGFEVVFFPSSSNGGGGVSVVTVHDVRRTGSWSIIAAPPRTSRMGTLVTSIHLFLHLYHGVTKKNGAVVDTPREEQYHFFNLNLILF